MIGIALLVGAGLLGLGTLVTVFWDEIITWAKRAYNAVVAKIRRVIEGFRTFVKAVRAGIEEIIKYYSKNGKQWKETTVSRSVSPDEVPEDIRAKAERRRNTETEITKEMELAMQQ